MLIFCHPAWVAGAYDMNTWHRPIAVLPVPQGGLKLILIWPPCRIGYLGCSDAQNDYCV